MNICRQKPKIEILSTKVVGTTFIKDKRILHYLKVRYINKEPVKFIIVRDYKNKYDLNAIKVLVGSSDNHSKNVYPIGYIPKELSYKLSPLLDNKKITIKPISFIVYGGEINKPNIGIALELAIKYNN